MVGDFNKVKIKAKRSQAETHPYSRLTRILKRHWFDFRWGLGKFFFPLFPSDQSIYLVSRPLKRPVGEVSINYCLLNR